MFHLKKYLYAGALTTTLLWTFMAGAVPLTITTQENTYHFTVEVADTLKKAQRGLMFRTQLDPNAGMVFIAPKDQVWNMWMKNTFIPLDMVFFKRNGQIHKIIENVQPHDLTSQSSDIPVAGVLELNAGIAATYSIQIGDTISFDKNTER